MSSHSNHARPNLCRNPLTRSPWVLPLLLLIASPVTKGLAVGGTLVFGTGCAEPTVDECGQWLNECVRACASDDGPCQLLCYEEHDVCVEEAYYAEERTAERVDAIADASMACLAVAACTFESLSEDEGGGEEEGEGDGDEWPVPDAEPEPDSSDDWGEDWGEQNPSEELALSSPADLPEEQ